MIRAARCFTALASLAIAGLAVARYASPALDHAVASWGIALGGAVVVSMAAAYLVAMRLAARDA